MKSLGKYSTGIKAGPGFITSHVAGRTVECFGMDGTWLIVRFTDGHEARIGWQDKSGNKLQGEPFLENLDVRIVLQGADLKTGAGQCRD